MGRDRRDVFCSAAWTNQNKHWIKHEEEGRSCHQVMAKTTANVNKCPDKRLDYMCSPPSPCVPKKPGSSVPLLTGSQSLSLSMGINYRHRLQSLFLLGFSLWWSHQSVWWALLQVTGTVKFSHSCISFKSFTVPTEGDKSSTMQSQAINAKIIQKILDREAGDTLWGSSLWALISSTQSQLPHQCHFLRMVTRNPCFVCW